MSQPESVSLQPGTRIHDYILEKRIGAGGMGEVWRGAHPVIGKKVAVKLLSPELTTNPTVMARFTQEARAVNEIRHRNIVDIFAFGELPDKRPYLVMELLDGRSLGDELAARSILSYAETAHILEQACKALHAAHERGIVHRDLKPDNIFLVPEPGAFPFVKVLDFGIAKLHQPEAGGLATKAGVIFGTPGYMSPEQCESTKDVDRRTDIYALGVILYEMLSGKLPFEAREGESVTALIVKQLTSPPPPLSDLAPDREIPRDLDAFLLDVLSRNPAQRPQTCLDLYKGFVAAVGSAMHAPAPAGRPVMAAPDVPSRAEPEAHGSATGYAPLIQGNAQTAPSLDARPAPRPASSEPAGATPRRIPAAVAAARADERDTDQDREPPGATPRQIPAAAPGGELATTPQLPAFLAESPSMPSRSFAAGSIGTKPPTTGTIPPAPPARSWGVPALAGLGALLLGALYVWATHEPAPAPAPPKANTQTPAPAGTPSPSPAPPEPTPAPPPEPAVEMVTFTITSDPPNADVMLDGAFVGKTPLPLQVPQGNQQRLIRVEKTGFMPREVLIAPQVSAGIDVPLAPAPAMFVPTTPGRSPFLPRGR